MSYSAPEPGTTNQPEPQQPYTQQPHAGQPTAVLQATGQEPTGQGWANLRRPSRSCPRSASRWAV
ncbi:hypothetical protein AHiyo8_35370 [Arthrobacter sp. Hiyo8]|nr:hypothetical protein AHiyo8_35370 [Arthrobacter sp. Hiyo8]